MKRFLLLTLLVSAITLIGCNSNSTMPDEQDVITEVTRTSETTLPNNSDANNQTSDPATLSPEVDLDCNRFENDPEGLAVCESQNLSTQQYVDDENTLLNALESKDASKCAEILNVHDRDDCYFNLAYQLENPALCEDITGFNTRIVCQRDLTEGE